MPNINCNGHPVFEASLNRLRTFMRMRKTVTEKLENDIGHILDIIRACLVLRCGNYTRIVVGSLSLHWPVKIRIEGPKNGPIRRTEIN